MTKNVISHENNISSANSHIISTNKNSFLSPKATPFLDSWKSEMLAKAKLLNIAVPKIEPIDFKVLLDSVNERLLQQSESIDNLQYIVDTSSDFSDVLIAQEQLYLKKAAFYNIKLDKDQWCSVTDLHMFDAVDSWERQLKEALFLGVNWRMNNYDPEGLELAIEQQEELCAIDSSLERQQANAYYYSTRGC